jgi:hypothetical protein
MPTTRKKLQGICFSLHFEPPTSDEAVYAAQGLEAVERQFEIAAMLMVLPEAGVRAVILKATALGVRSGTQLATPARSSFSRPFIVERQNPRFVIG